MQRVPLPPSLVSYHGGSVCHCNDEAMAMPHLLRGASWQGRSDSIMSVTCNTDYMQCLIFSGQQVGRVHIFISHGTLDAHRTACSLYQVFWTLGIPVENAQLAIHPWHQSDSLVMRTSYTYPGRGRPSPAAPAGLSAPFRRMVVPNSATPDTDTSTASNRRVATGPALPDRSSNVSGRNAQQTGQQKVGASSKAAPAVRGEGLLTDEGSGVVCIGYE